MTTTTTIPARSPSTIVALYTLLVRFANKLQSPLLLFIRLYIGYQCVISGWAHLHNVDKTATFFSSLHIPFPKANVYASASTEIAGGVLLFVGLFSRPTALALTFNFLVAMLTVQLSNYDFSYKQLTHQIWVDQSPILGDTAFPFLATALVVLIFGPGWLSFDGLIKLVRS